MEGKEVVWEEEEQAPQAVENMRGCLQTERLSSWQEQRKIYYQASKEKKPLFQILPQCFQKIGRAINNTTKTN